MVSLNSMTPPPQILNEIARNDTPQVVQVPDTWSGLIVWAIGRFGGIVVATFIACYAAAVLYKDNTTRNEKFFEMFSKFHEERAKSDSKLAEALGIVNTTLIELSAEARAAHQTSQGSQTRK